MQDAVDAVLDRHVSVAGLDVNIARASLQRVEHGGVDQLDDGSDPAVPGEPVDREGLVGILGRADVEGELLGDLLQNSLGLFRLVQQVVDLRQGRDRDPQLLAEQSGDLVKFRQARRIGDGDLQSAVGLGDRHEVVPKHQIDRDRPEQIAVNVSGRQVQERVTVTRRQLACIALGRR